MGVSLLTAFQIQENPNILVGVQRGENGKFYCAIMHGKEKRFRILLSSDPIYDTAKDAEQAGQAVVDEIKAMDLGVEREELISLIPEYAREMMLKIVDASQ